MKNILTNLIMLTVSTLVILLVAEVVTRVTVGEQTVLYPRYHTDAHYGEFKIRRVRPNSMFRHRSIDGQWEFRTNSHGFRDDREISYEKPPGVTRILTLGDSHTQGYEVRQEFTFSTTLERYLANRGKDVEVINTGVSGFGTAEQLVLLENEGLRFHPDVVVLGFFANDFEDNVKSGLFRLDDTGELILNRKEHLPGVRIQNFIYQIPGMSWLGENSYFYSVLFNTAWELAKQRLTESSMEEVTEFAVPQEEEFSDYDIALTMALISRLALAVRSNDLKFVIVDVPTRTTDGGFESSFPDQTKPFLRAAADAYIDSEQLLGKYEHVAEIHVPNGHNHIGEFTHTMIGVAIGADLEQLLSEQLDD